MPRCGGPGPCPTQRQPHCGPGLVSARQCCRTCADHHRLIPLCIQSPIMSCSARRLFAIHPAHESIPGMSRSNMSMSRQEVHHMETPLDAELERPDHKNACSLLAGRTRDPCRCQCTRQTSRVVLNATSFSLVLSARRWGILRCLRRRWSAGTRCRSAAGRAAGARPSVHACRTAPRLATAGAPSGTSLARRTMALKIVMLLQPPHDLACDPGPFSSPCSVYEADRESEVCFRTHVGARRTVAGRRRTKPPPAAGKTRTQTTPAAPGRQRQPRQRMPPRQRARRQRRIRSARGLDRAAARDRVRRHRRGWRSATCGVRCGRRKCLRHEGLCMAYTVDRGHFREMQFLHALTAT